MYEIFSIVGALILGIIVYLFLWKFYQFEKHSDEKKISYSINILPMTYTNNDYYELFLIQLVNNPIIPNP